MKASILKEVMKAMRDNNMARIKAIAQASRTTPGKLMASLKKKKKK